MKRFCPQTEIKFECPPDCADCCKLSNGFVFLTDVKVLQLAENLAISENVFLHYFTKIMDEQLCLVEGEDENSVF